MKIECILKRPGGTHAEIGGITYHFAPNSDGAHVADVTDNKHIQRFFGIPEGYRIYGEPAAKEDRDADGDIDAKDERLALSEQFKEKFGKAPHHKMSLDAIRQKLAE
jgi:hypothetical protein